MHWAWIFVLVLSAGALFSCGDAVARAWGQNMRSVPLLLLMGAIGTGAYAVFGVLTRNAEFTRSAIWVSLSLTSMTVCIGTFWFQEPFTFNKGVACVLALAACYFSVR